MSETRKLPTGRRRVPQRPMLRLGEVLTGQVPQHPATVDYIAAMHGGWQMLGNDRAGDCVAVRWANARRLTTKLLTGTASYPSQDEVWALYKTQNPDFDPNGTASTNGPGSPADRGMDSQALADYLVKHGGPDGVKAVCFAQVDHRNLAEVEAAIAIFGSIWIDCLVLDGNQQQFSQGDPWTNDGSQIDGGHAILGGAYFPASGEHGIVGTETWAAESSLAPSYWNGTAGGQPLIEAAYVMVWPEHLGTAAFQDGVNVQALEAAYTALTGRPFPAVTPPQPGPVPDPSPAPAPSPGPAPDAATATFVAALDEWLRHRHESPVNVTLLRAARVWKQALGYQ